VTHHLQHGSILGGVVTVPDLQAALADYHDVLGMTILENCNLAKDLAQSWACPNSADQPMAVLQPTSGAQCFIRLIEQPDHPGFKPTTTFGWAAYELTVKDVFGWPERLQGCGFDIVGPPKELEGLPYFIPMQVLGRGREMIYLNEVRENTPSSDLPKARSMVDQIFICILAAPDRAACVAWYEEKLGLDAGDTYSLPYSMINKAFDLPADYMSDLTMVQNDRLTILEIDDYPKEATDRASHDDMLPPGNALVTLAVDSLDAINADWIKPPKVREGDLYQGRRSAATKGPAGELLELIEIS